MSPGEQMVFAVAFVDALAELPETNFIDEYRHVYAATQASAAVDALKEAYRLLDKEVDSLYAAKPHDFTEQQRRRLDKVGVIRGRVVAMRGVE